MTAALKACAMFIAVSFVCHAAAHFGLIHSDPRDVALGGLVIYLLIQHFERAA